MHRVYKYLILKATREGVCVLGSLQVKKTSCFRSAKYIPASCLGRKNSKQVGKNDLELTSPKVRAINPFCSLIAHFAAFQGPYFAWDSGVCLCGRTHSRRMRSKWGFLAAEVQTKKKCRGQRVNLDPGIDLNLKLPEFPNQPRCIKLASFKKHLLHMITPRTYAKERKIKEKRKIKSEFLKARDRNNQPRFFFLFSFSGWSFSEHTCVPVFLEEKKGLFSSLHWGFVCCDGRGCSRNWFIPVPHNSNCSAACLVNAIIAAERRGLDVLQYFWFVGVSLANVSDCVCVCVSV